MPMQRKWVCIEVTVLLHVQYPACQTDRQGRALMRSVARGHSIDTAAASKWQYIIKCPGNTVLARKHATAASCESGCV